MAGLESGNIHFAYENGEKSQYVPEASLQQYIVQLSQPQVHWPKHSPNDPTSPLLGRTQNQGLHPYGAKPRHSP